MMALPGLEAEVAAVDVPQNNAHIAQKKEIYRR